MSWMGRVYGDAMHLQEVMAERLEMDPGELGYELEEKFGWVCPTVSGLARKLINEVMERTPHDDKDVEQMERVIALLGTGE